MKKYLVVFSLVFVMLMSLSLNVLAQEVVIKLAHEEPKNVDNSSAHAAAVAFKNVIESQSNGEMEVKIYAGGSMGTQREAMNLLKGNMLQVNVASIGGLSTFYPEISAIEVPFALPNHNVAYEVFDGEFGDYLAKKIEENVGVKFLTTSAGGFYVLTNNKRPIKKPEDMKGLKIRTMSVPTHTAMMQGLGASVTQVAWSELYTSLQTGVVEGQHNPIPIMAIGGLEEVQDYATLTNHLYGADWWIANQDFYNSLTTEQKKIFDNAVKTAKIVGRGHKQLTSSTEYGVSFLEDAGIEVYSPTSEELKAFKDAVVPAVKDKIGDKFGDEGLEIVNELLEAVEKVEKDIY